MSKTGLFVGQVVWADYGDLPWWPVTICDIEDPVEESIPSGCYVFRYVDGSHGYAESNKIRRLEEMDLQTALRDPKAVKFEHQIEKDYETLCNNIPTKHLATTRSQLLVNVFKRTQGMDDFIEVVAGVKKKRKLSSPEEEEDQIMTDTIPEEFIDSSELGQILQVYNNKGFLGILESFGMTFANLKFSLDQMDLTEIGSQIYQHNSSMEPGLKQYLCDFLTSFSTQWKKEFEYCSPDEDYLLFLEKQYKEAKVTSEKLKRHNPAAQHQIVRISTPSLFLPLFKLKNMIDSETHLGGMTFQEYFSMVFKQFHIFTGQKQQGIFFKTGEAIESDSLKLSLNIMNKKWIENTSRIQPDFVLMRSSNYYIHYFVIGEFDNNHIKASTAEEFLCCHKDTVKIILEGRAVLKDIVSKLVTNRVEDEIKKRLVVRLFLADTSGKLVILKMCPIFHQIQRGLHGIYYELSYSKLLNLFDKQDAFTFMSEIDNSVGYACSLLYGVDENNLITSLCAIPVTLKSKSNMEKLFSIPTNKASGLKEWFDDDDEKRLFEYLAKEFPYLSVKKEKVITFDLANTIPILISLVDESFSLNTTTGNEVFGNPIYAGYAVVFGKKLLRIQTISFNNTNKIGGVKEGEKKEPETDLDDDYLNPKQHFSTSTPTRTTTNSYQNTSTLFKIPKHIDDNVFRKQIQDVTFKQWGLADVINQNIHTRTIPTDSGILTSYICYCEGHFIKGNTTAFVKIHSGHMMETHNSDSISRYAKERIKSDCSDAKHAINIYKYFLEDVSVPYEVFGDISTPVTDYKTDITISELLTPVETSKLSELKMEDVNSKLLILLYVIDGCLRGIKYIVRNLNLLHNDIAFRNVMIRSNTNKSIFSTLLNNYCNITLTDDIVVTDINNCKMGTESDFQNDMHCLGEVFVEFILFIFGIEKPRNDLKYIETLELFSIQGNQIRGDFKIVHTWIVQIIEALLKNEKRTNTKLAPFEDDNFYKALAALDEVVVSLFQE